MKWKQNQKMLRNQIIKGYIWKKTMTDIYPNKKIKKYISIRNIVY